MNKTAKHSVMALLAATVGLCASFANAQTTATAVDRVYAIDQRGEVVMDPFGLCWRLHWWTPAAAAKDPDIHIEPAWKVSLVYGMPCAIYHQLPAAYYHGNRT